jgi:HAMP domain-containing protein
MKKKIISVVLAISLLAPITANAGFLKTMVESWGFTLTLTASDMLDLFGALADDIGEMGDRILLMADEIGEMADKIGVMADRIVTTEQMMADMTVELAQISSSVADLSGTTAPTVLISSDTLTISTDEAPSFTISTATPEYVVYVSSTLVMNTNTTSVIVHNYDELQEKWAQLKTLAANGQVHIAVKTIDNNSISSLSNVLSYTTY